MPLTELQLKAFKSTGKPQKLFDGGGLYAHDQGRTGKLFWRLKTRISGKERLFTIGPYPDVSLKQARSAVAQIKLGILAGNDPALTKKASKREQLLALKMLLKNGCPYKRATLTH